MDKRFILGWTIIIFVMVSALVVMCLHIKNNNVDNILEKTFVSQAEKYYGLNPGLLPSKGKEKVVTLEDLKLSGYDPKLGKSCNGYIIITNKTGVSKYKAYIKCDKYETKGYDEKYLKNK